ncbi:unnamed protein product [Aphanomyces euteiches]
MNAFVAAVFANDAFSFSSASTAEMQWQVWMRPSESGDVIHLNVFVAAEDVTTLTSTAMTLDALIMQQHMNELGVTSDLSSFAQPFKSALITHGNVRVEVEDHSSVIVEITYAFGASLTRKGLFQMPMGTPVPRHVVDLLKDLHVTMNETHDQRAARRSHRTEKLLPIAAPLQLSEVPVLTSTQTNADVPLKRKVLPLGARRRVARGAKFARDDDDDDE